MFRPQFIRQPIMIKGLRCLSTAAVDQTTFNGAQEIPISSHSSSPAPAQIRFFFFYHQRQGIKPPPHPKNQKLFDKVIIPAKTGRRSILPGHPATHVLLKPGVISLVCGNDTTKYFTIGGFAFIHAHSRVDVATDQEAIPLDHFDPAEVQKGLAEFTQMLSSASTDLEKAEAQIGLEVHSALNAALQEHVEEGPVKSTQLL